MIVLKLIFCIFQLVVETLLNLRQLLNNSKFQLLGEILKIKVYPFTVSDISMQFCKKSMNNFV